MSDSVWGEFFLEVLKPALKPGFLYGVKDGKLYMVEADIPAPGEKIFEVFEMPPKEET